MPRVSLSILDALRGHPFLTLGIPGAEQSCEELVGPRLVWWPRGLPAGERVAVISSRLGRWGKLPPHWFSTLRRVLDEVDPTRQTLVTARETPLAELVEWWANARHAPILILDVAKPRQSLRRWWAECRRAADGTPGLSHSFRACVSPPLTDAQTAAIPARDAILVAASDRVVVCQVRPRGNIWRLLEQRLAMEANTACRTTTILIGPGFSRREAVETLRQRGAQLQIVSAVGRTQDLIPNGGGSAVGCGSRGADLVFTLPELPCLLHCTRAIEGPWPDQARSDYLDSLLWGDADTQRTPLATLTRIIRQEKLLATGRAIRGRFPMVCFTAVELRDLPALRTFRAHRSRWDFEPYGIAICRSWLTARGARPVTYGDDSVWEQLDAAERPFFQRRFAGPENSIDWSVEQEWRHVGTCDLRDVPSDLAFVFVPTAAAAVLLRPLSRWPVLVLPLPS